MSTTQSNAESESDAESTATNYSRLKSYQRLGVEISETVVAKGGGDKPRVVQTPLNNEIGRVTVAGTVTNTDVEIGSVGKLTIDVGNNYQLTTYAYTNDNGNPNPTDLKAISEGTHVSLTLRPDVYGQNNPDVNGIHATPRLEQITPISEETLWANLAEAAANTLNRVAEYLPEVEAHEEDIDSDAFDPEVSMWNAHYSESDVRSIQTHAEIILEKAKAFVRGDDPAEVGSDGESESKSETESDDGESDGEHALRTVLEQHDVYPPAVETLVTEFDTPWDMIEADNLGDLNNVGRGTLEDIDTIEEELGV